LELSKYSSPDWKKKCAGDRHEWHLVKGIFRRIFSPTKKGEEKSVCPLSPFLTPGKKIDESKKGSLVSLRGGVNFGVLRHFVSY
jgi:hypothetical protein